MKTFVTRICPLCSKKLKQGDEDSTYDYYCEEFFLRDYSDVFESWYRNVKQNQNYSHITSLNFYFPYNKEDYVGLWIKEQQLKATKEVQPICNLRRGRDDG